MLEIIRFAEESDCERVAELARLAWSGIYDGYKTQLGDEIYETVYENPLEIKAEKMCSAVRDGRVLVCEIDGRVAAFASFLAEGEVGALKENAVDPEYKGRGIAGRMYDAAIAELKSLGCTVVRVTTGLDDAHAPARRAYEKAGFEHSLSSIVYYKKI